MVDTCRITVLSENTAHDECLIPEYGLSLWIEVDGVKILFDTGQSDNFARNAERIDVPLEQ
ncbi:MAG TPA: MBL fold metallo-hydrolase, partial [Deltaproteobacteria bacterium]|nr:MBL fold metallo-hydrolase [Deltaproteobacteria bacterium]